MIPSCSHCIHFNNGLCKLFTNKGYTYYAVMARLEVTKCGIEGTRFIKNKKLESQKEKLD